MQITTATLLLIATIFLPQACNKRGNVSREAVVRPTFKEGNYLLHLASYTQICKNDGGTTESSTVEPQDVTYEVDMLLYTISIIEKASQFYGQWNATIGEFKTRQTSISHAEDGTTSAIIANMNGKIATDDTISGTIGSEVNFPKTGVTCTGERNFDGKYLSPLIGASEEQP